MEAKSFSETKLIREPNRSGREVENPAESLPTRLFDQVVGEDAGVRVVFPGSTERLAASLQKLGELIEYTEASRNASGSLEAERSIIASASALGPIIEGSLKSAKVNRIIGGSSIEARIASLPPEQADQAQNQIDLLLNTVSAVDNLGSAKRIEPYLPIEFPRTQTGFKTLRLIAEKFVETIPIPEEKSLGDIPEALRMLSRQDEQLRERGLNDPELIEALSGPAGRLAQARIEKSKIDCSGEVSKIRAGIAQQKIYALKREFVEIPGTPGLSRCEILENQIIEREGQTLVDAARAEAEARRERERETVLDEIAKRRAIDSVVALIDQDPLLRKVLAKRSRLKTEDLLQANLSKKQQVAKKALNTKRITLSIEYRRVFCGAKIIGEEKVRLTQSLLDPLSFVTSISDDELAVIRQGISNASDERSLYQLAGDRLRKQLEDEVTDGEILPILKSSLIKEILFRRAPEAIDNAIAQIGIDRETVLKDPGNLEQLRDEIIPRALEYLITSSLEESSDRNARAITDDERRRQREASMVWLREIGKNRSDLSSEARLLLDQSIRTPEVDSLGTISLREDIKSTLGPFQTYQGYKTVYPPIVLKALESLYAEYNRAFGPLIAANRENETDYQYCMTPDGTPINSFVQIDMVGLPARFLQQAATFQEEEVREALRGRIFEIENSIAMYSLLGYCFADGTEDALFRRQFLAGLDSIRERCGKPIALLAVTDEKYQAMRESEFGKGDSEPFTDEEVREYSGFDKFFSPGGFRRYVEENGGESDYLLYVRSSDPVAKMKRPELIVDEPILSDDDMRRAIKANSLTFNIDRPDLPIGDEGRINDTKGYLVPMGMAFPVFYNDDLTSEEFDSYLRSQGVDPSEVRSGETLLRAKPMKGTYGGYGHIRGTLVEGRSRRELRDALLRRGPYIVQPELQNPTITNRDDGRSCVYIDRVFFSSDGQNYQFMGGERTLMPIDSIEADNNRVHGNESSVYAEIIK